MNTITFELCAEDRARLDRVIEALENRPNCEGCVSAALEYAQEERDAAKPEKKEEAPTTNPPKEEKPVETPTEHPLDAPPIEVNEPTAPEAPTVTREDVRGKVVKLCAAGKKEDVKKVVTAYAEAVKDIPEDKLAEVFEKLTALEG